MYHGLSLQGVRDESGKLVGFHLTTGEDTWDHSLITGFLVRLHRGTADIKVAEKQIIFTRDDMKYYPRAFALSKKDANDLRAVVTKIVAEIRSEPRPELQFNYLGIPGIGFRIVSEDMRHLQPSGKRIRPEYPKES